MTATRSCPWISRRRVTIAVGSDPTALLSANRPRERETKFGLSTTSSTDTPLGPGSVSRDRD